MATIEIRDILDNETGKTIFPRTHVDAVIGLQDSSFFEAVQDTQDPTKFSVKLKSGYTGLWAEGWIAACGVGSGSGGGGGGGLITSVKGVADLGTPILTESLSETFSAKAIESIYENAGTSLSLTSATQTSYLKDSNGNYLLDSDGNRLALPGSSSVTRLNLLNGAGSVLSSVDLNLDLSSYATESWVTDNFQPTISDLETIRTDATEGAAKVSNVQSDWDATTGLAAILNKPDLSVYALQTDLASVSARLSAIEGWFEVVTVGTDSALHAKNGYAIYSDSWIAAGGIGSGSGGGGGVSSLYDLVEVESNTSPSLNDVFYFDGTKWTSTSLKTIGGVSLLGSGDIRIGGGSEVEVYNLLSIGTRVATIRIGGSSGTAYDILAPTGGGSGGATILNDLTDVAISSASNGDLMVYNSTTGLWENGTKASVLTDYALKTGSPFYNFQANSIAFTGGSLTGPNPNSGTHRLVYTYTTGGMSVDDPIETVIKTVSFLDDIPSSLVNPYALTFGNKTYDGSVAQTITASDLGALTEHQSLANYVTLDGTQTITGTKTFSVNQNFKGSLYLYNSDNLSGQIVASGYMVFRTGSAINLSDSTTYKQLTFHQSYGLYPEQSINLGYNSANGRWANIYGVNGNLTGDLTMTATSHIDIGPLRIEYDDTNKALRITKVSSSDTNTYGLYADGFVAAGGVGQSS